MARRSIIFFAYIALIALLSSETLAHKRIIHRRKYGWVASRRGPTVLLNIRGGASDTLQVQCLLHGKTYDITATTVADVKRRVQLETGYHQIQVFFRGEELVDEDMLLSEADVQKGDILSLTVRGEKKKKNVPKSKNKAKSRPKESPASGGISQLMEGMGGMGSMEKMMQQLGMEGELTPEKMEEQMKSVLSNPQITQMLDNPLIMEQSRQQIVNNPMMMQMFESMGLGPVFKDPKAYAEHMGSVKEMLKDPELLKTLGQTTNMSKKPPKDDDFDQGDL